LSDPDDGSTSTMTSTSSNNNNNVGPRVIGQRCHHHCNNWHGHQNRNHHKKHHHKSLLKPIPPKKYDGLPRPQIFHHFMTQVTDYVNDG
jgi:hypothetical protein